MAEKDKEIKTPDELSAILDGTPVVSEVEEKPEEEAPKETKAKKPKAKKPKALKKDKKGKDTRNKSEKAPETKEAKIEKIEVRKNEILTQIDEHKAEQEKLTQDIAELHIKDNLSLINDALKCANCGAKLPLVAEDYLIKLQNPITPIVVDNEVDCVDCGMRNNFHIRYDEDYTVAAPSELKVTPIDFVWNKISVAYLTPEQVQMRLEEEEKRIDRGTDKNLPMVKALIKEINLLRKEVNELKCKK